MRRRTRLIVGYGIMFVAGLCVNVFMVWLLGAQPGWLRISLVFLTVFATILVTATLQAPWIRRGKP